MRNKILMTLALLLTAVTGAWAQGKLIYEKDFSSDTFYPFYLDAAEKTGASATVTDGLLVLTNPKVQETNWDVQPEIGRLTSAAPTTQGNTYRVVMQYKTTVAGSVTFALGAQNWSNADWSGQTITVSNDFQTCEAYFNNYPYSNSESHILLQFGELVGTITIKKVEVYELYPFPITWDATNKTTGFSLPAGNVFMNVEYYPAAVLATDGEPTAIDGIIAGEAKDIVKAGIVAKVGSTENAQGTLMYLVTTTKEQPTSTTGFSATVPTGATLTGSYTENQTVYVWYYIKGIDAAEGVTPTAENTFNDSKICAEPIKVTVLSNKFDIQFNAANANTIEAKKATVTVGGTAATVTEGKLEGVKMGSEVKVKANEGYKFRKVEAKKNRVAEGHALTLAKFGEIVCSDSKAYAAADKDILPKGVKAEALVCYVDGNGHGLALAMADVKNEKMSWNTGFGANDGKTAAEWCTGWNTSHPITGATWLLASQTQWNNMINAAGSASNLSNAFSAVGGTNLQAWSYWSSTSLHNETAAYSYYFPSSSWQWEYFYKDYYGSYIRACLEW